MKPLFTATSENVHALVSESPRQNHFRTALILALILHVLLATLVPPIDELKVFPATRDLGINIFLNKKDEPKPFDKNLNQQLPLPDADRALVDPALGSASPELGEQSFLSEQTPETDSSRSDAVDTTAASDQKTSSVRTAVSFDLAAIKVFAQQEAIRTAERNPKQVARFKRSFNSRRNYQRRTRTESYKNQYGDYYLKTRSSVGDICFVQKQDGISTEVNTSTVYFFECGKKPLKLDLDADSQQ